MSSLLLGISREDITPQIGCNLYGYNPDIYSESIHDNLDATAFAFGYGEKTAILVSVTVCAINDELQLRIRNEISKNEFKKSISRIN